MRNVVLLALGLASAPASAANLLANAGFETGALSPWTAPSGSPVVTDAQAHSGQYSVAAFGGDAIMQTFAAVATSSVSQASFWVKRSGGVFDSLTFFYSDQSSTDALIQGSGDDWQFFDLTSKLAANKTLVGFQIYGTSPGPAYLDDFVIDGAAGGVPEPATWAMMIAGFGLAGAVARRRSFASAAGPLWIRVGREADVRRGGLQA